MGKNLIQLAIEDKRFSPLVERVLDDEKKNDRLLYWEGNEGTGEFVLKGQENIDIMLTIIKNVGTKLHDQHVSYSIMPYSR